MLFINVSKDTHKLLHLVVIFVATHSMLLDCELRAMCESSSYCCHALSMIVLYIYMYYVIQNNFTQRCKLRGQQAK